MPYFSNQQLHQNVKKNRSKMPRVLGIIPDFTGYYASGTEFMIEHPMPNGSFTFDDFHWTLSDYFNLIRSNGFTVDELDECAPDEKFKTDEKFWKRRTDYPTYLIFICSKQK